MAQRPKKLKNFESQLSPKSKKIIGIVSIVVLFILFGLVAVFIGKPLVKFIGEPENFRAWVDEKGFVSRIIFIGMVMLQVLVAIIPGEPFETGAGYAFGAVEGTILCLAGITAASVLIFLFVKKFGVRVVEAFFSIEKINSLKFLRDHRRRNILAFIVFFIPGTPKDLLTYFVGLTDMKLSTWLLICTIARIPSVITSTIAGNALGREKYTFAIIIYAVTAVISIAGIFIYNRISQKHRQK